MRVTKMILKKIKNFCHRKNQQDNYYCYFDNPKDNLSMSNIQIDLRNPVKGKKYLSIG